MKRYVIFLSLILLEQGLSAQQDIRDNNMRVLHDLEEKYKSPCLKYVPGKVENKRMKIDKKLIKELNKVYQTKLNYLDIINFLEKKGYNKKRRTINPNWVNDTIIFERVNQGYLDSYIKLIYGIRDRRLLSKKIILVTKTHFFCETKEWQSYSYIDFVYLRLFIKKIKIPLQIASSNVELESK